MIRCRSAVNPLSIRCQSAVDPLSIRCRSADNLSGHRFFGSDLVAYWLSGSLALLLTGSFDAKKTAPTLLEGMFLMGTLSYL